MEIKLHSNVGSTNTALMTSRPYIISDNMLCRVYELGSGATAGSSFGSNLAVIAASNCQRFPFYRAGV